MNVLVFWMGTTGDAYPFMGISQALARRGHQITMFGNGHFRSLADGLGFKFVDLITPEQYEQRLIERSRALDLESLKVNSSYVAQDLRPAHQAVLDHHVPGETLVISQSYLLGTRVAQEELGFPLVTTHLHPMLIRSELAKPWWMPRLLVRLGHRLLDIVIDAALAPHVNELRLSRGLPTVSRIMDRWWNSPDLILAAFPEWFAPARADWPPAARQIGFPEFHPREDASLSAGTSEFLNAGDPPLVFTHSPAVKLLDGFVEHSLAAARALHSRALFLGIPESTPASHEVHFSRGEPHELLLPRARGIVHHGGLGTAIAAIRAGIPQLCVPQMLDQPSNANTLKKLGVGASVPWRKYHARQIARAFGKLLEDPRTMERCQLLQQRLKSDPDACERAADAVEELIARRTSSR